MRTCIAVLACLAAAGCVSTKVHRLDNAVRPARSPETVSVLTEAPTRPYVVIAFIESRGRSAFDGFDDLRREMVADAARLGGDAVILGPEASDESFILTGQAMIRSEERRLVGQVIAYRDG